MLTFTAFFQFLFRPLCGQLCFNSGSTFDPWRKFAPLTAGSMAAELTQTLFSIKCFYGLNFTRSHGIWLWVNGFSSYSYETISSREKRHLKLRTQQDYATQQIPENGSSSQTQGLIRACFANRRM